ncbi:MAG: phosphoribosylformylglycinamidine cyclo-ligase [Candidatus Omnitrophica bacterium]|nr:phosphoribosylformylglycinamidine cyclo-ligase [Candidatus Omnitrophota bacterium]
MKTKITYKKAGVDINKANDLIEQIKPIVASTKRPGCVGNIGAFAAFFKPNIKKYKTPLIVSATDGVGTKLKIAQLADRHDTIGIDLVAMCVNDIITCGAEPLIFLDYFATGKLESPVMKKVIEGIVKGCKEANTALVGGETAELPGMYEKGSYDLAGFGIGIVDEKDVIDGRKIKEGDLVIGLESSGIHSNGYSLVRKIFSDQELKKDKALLNEILQPTKIYVKAILDIIKSVQVKGISHLTGGGFFDNIIRILPEEKACVILKRSWEEPQIFKTMQERGNINAQEMFRTFNMGIGMVLVVAKKNAWDIRTALSKRHNIKSWIIGEIIKGQKRVELIES